MTEAEVGKLLAVAEGAYPEKTAFWNEATQRNLAKSWTLVLSQYTYEQGNAAILVYLKNDKYNRFPGVGQIADIIENLNETVREDYMTASQAWAVVRPAIRDGIYHSKEHFAELPEIIQIALGGADRLKEWAQMPSETIDSVIRSDFCNRMYPVAVKRRQDYERLPIAVRERFDAMHGQIAKKHTEKLEKKKTERIETRQTVEYDRSDHGEEIEILEKNLRKVNNGTQKTSKV